MTTGGGPTLMGVDVLWVATILAAVASMAVFFAIYAAVTVRDPMAKRVKSLNERREQLKAGITASTTKKRAKIIRQNDTTDSLRNILQSLKVLQSDQLKDSQQKLAQAGIRSKDLAYAVIFSRMVLPIVFGGIAATAIYGFNYLEEWSSLKRFGVFAGAVILGYKGVDLYINNLISKRTDLIRKGLPDAIDLLVICAEAGLTVDAAFARVSKELGSAYPELADEFSLTSIELGFLTERRQAFENLAYRVSSRSCEGRCHDHDPDREIWYTIGILASGICPQNFGMIG